MPIPSPPTTSVHDEVQNRALYPLYSDLTLLVRELLILFGLQRQDPQHDMQLPLVGKDARGYLGCTDRTDLLSLAVVPSPM